MPSNHRVRKETLHFVGIQFNSWMRCITEHCSRVSNAATITASSSTSNSAIEKSDLTWIESLHLSNKYRYWLFSLLFAWYNVQNSILRSGLSSLRMRSKLETSSFHIIRFKMRRNTILKLVFHKMLAEQVFYQTAPTFWPPQFQVRNCHICVVFQNASCGQLKECYLPQTYHEGWWLGRGLLSCTLQPCSHSYSTIIW